MMKRLAVVAMLVLAGCAQRLKVEPVTVKPIHLFVDVTVHDESKPPAKK